MFIYKITNKKNNKSYIGFDSHPQYMSVRWKIHQRDCNLTDTKFYKDLRKGTDLFTYEIIDTADTILNLALKEIYWIEYYKSYKKGYNSTRGGDGLNQDLSKFSDEDIVQLKNVYSITMSEYNNNIKWKNTDNEQRQHLTKHLHTPEIYKKKSDTLIEFYKNHPDVCKAKGDTIKEYWNSLDDASRINQSKINKANGAIGAAKVSKKVKIEFSDGTIKIYDSKSAFNREHGEIINAILKKTQNNETHKGLKGWEI